MFVAVQKSYGNGNSGYRKYEFTLESRVSWTRKTRIVHD